MGAHRTLSRVQMMGPVRLEIQSRAVGIQEQGTSLPTGDQGDP